MGTLLPEQIVFILVRKKGGFVVDKQLCLPQFLCFLFMTHSFIFIKLWKPQGKCIYKTVNTLYKILYVTLTYCFTQCSTFLPL